MKTHKRAIAAFVALTFLTLLQISTMPLRAGQAPDLADATVESSEQAPNFVEEEGYDSQQTKKKSILPIIIGVAAAAAVAAVLVLVVFKTKYDITGSWDFDFTSTSPAHTWNWSLLFKGDKKSGTFIDEYNDTGKYNIDGKNVTITYDEWDIQMTGAFDGKEKIRGSATFSGLTIGSDKLRITAATWIATRRSAANASLQPGALAGQSAAGRKNKE